MQVTLLDKQTSFLSYVDLLYASSMFLLIGIVVNRLDQSRASDDSHHDGPARENLVRLNESKTRIDYRLL